MHCLLLVDVLAKWVDVFIRKLDRFIEERSIKGYQSWCLRELPYTEVANSEQSDGREF